MHITKNELGVDGSRTYGSEFWSPVYKNIFICNSAIEGLSKSSKLTASVKKQLLGEAKFIRAYFYYYLVNLFGDVPIITSTDHRINSNAIRNKVNEVYSQIITDLTEAKSLLSENFLNENLKIYSSVPERVRRFEMGRPLLFWHESFLNTGDYNNAEFEASEVISQSSLFELPAFADVFKKNSKKAIWQLQPVASGHNTRTLGSLFFLNQVLMTTIIWVIRCS